MPKIVTEKLLCKYGTPLPPYTSDEIARRRGSNSKTEIGADSDRASRIHGVFEGEFAAGYQHTIDSTEGWESQFEGPLEENHSEEADSESHEVSDFVNGIIFESTPQRARPTKSWLNVPIAPHGKSRELRFFTNPMERYDERENSIIEKYSSEIKSECSAHGKRFEDPVQELENLDLDLDDYENSTIEEVLSAIGETNQCLMQERMLNRTEIDQNDYYELSSILMEHDMYGVGYSVLNQKLNKMYTCDLLASINRNNNDGAGETAPIAEEEVEVHATQKDSFPDAEGEEKREANGTTAIPDSTLDEFSKLLIQDEVADKRSISYYDSCYKKISFVDVLSEKIRKFAQEQGSKNGQTEYKNLSPVNHELKNDSLLSDRFDGKRINNAASRGCLRKVHSINSLVEEPERKTKKDLCVKYNIPHPIFE